MLEPASVHSVKREILQNFSVSLPLIVTNVIFAFSNFIGTVMLAKLGQDALAASVLVNMMWASLSILFMGILHAICVLVSHQFGARNYKAISEIMGQAYIVGFLICILVISVLYSMQFFLEWSGQPAAVLQLSYQYMHALMWTIPSLIVWIVLEQFLMGIGHTKLALRISLLVVPVEIPLMYVLIFGKLGFPHCGVAGIGYAFTITYTLSAIGLVLYLLRAKQYRSYRIFSLINRLNFPFLKEIIRIGVPLGFIQVVEMSSFAVATYWIGHFSTSILAAHQIVFQYLGFAIVVVFGMSQAVTVRVGHAVGKRDLLGIKYAVYVGMLLNFCIILCISSLFYLAPLALLSLDINIYDPFNKELIHAAVQLFAIASLLLLFDNFRIVGFGALRGLKDNRFSMATAIVAFWLVGLSFAYLFGFYAQLRAVGVWLGLTLGIVVGALIVFGRLQYFLRHLGVLELDKIRQV